MDPAFPFRFSRRRFLTAGAGALLPSGGGGTRAGAAEEALAACLPPGRWREVEAKVDGVLEALSRLVLPSRALGTGQDQQPAATAQIIMAFLSRGHAPGKGKYGAVLEKALDYVLSTQDAQGVFSTQGMTQNATYHHAISGLMLGEVYGLTGKAQAVRVREAIVKALAVSRRSQLATPGGAGMRYFTKPREADLSVTGAHFLFYRSAKNAEFDVPEAWVNQMLMYVKACAVGDGEFGYQPNNIPSLAMTSVGLLFLAMTGRQDHPVAEAAARQVLVYEYGPGTQRRAYSLYYASLAMSQMGGKYWREFYPRLVEAQLDLEGTVDGLVPNTDHEMGPALGNAFYILSLTPPCQVLPIFQR
ncbi:MAG: hypothetical protein V4726_05500 [Verrucomicrobiota bacterium]